MENTKVYQIIQGLSPSLRERVNNLLPAISGGTTTINYGLYRLIVDHISRGTGPLDRKAGWSVLYPGKNYKDTTLRKACTDLMKNMEYALSMLYLQEDDRNRRLQYLYQLKDIGFDHEFIKKEINKSKRKFEELDLESGPGYYERFRLEELEYENNYRSGSAWTKSNINRIDQNLNAFFILEKLRLALSIFSRQKYIQFEKELPFLEVIFQLIESGLIKDHPLIQLYYYAVKTYQNDDSETMYFRLKYGLNDASGENNSPNIRELKTIALSYCIGKINQNNSSFYREALDWYQLMLDDETLMDQGYLAATTYRNIVLIAIRLQEYDWAMNFTHQYSSYLKSDIQESTKMLSLGQIYFNRKDYDQVIDHLMNVDYINVSYNLQSKLILAATYYELDEYEVLTNFLATFKTYLHRKKPSMSSEKYFRHQKFISVLNQMTKTPAWEINKWHEIQRNLESDQKIVSYAWLKDKIDERIAKTPVVSGKVNP